MLDPYLEGIMQRMEDADKRQLYFIKRRSDKMWWDGDGWSATVAKAMSAAQAGTVLAYLPGGMDEGVYKLVPKREE